MPACAALLPCTLTTRAMIVPSPASGWYMKWKLSEAVIIVPDPAPDTVNIPLAKPALPATPTEPISPSDHTEGSVETNWTVRESVVVFVKLPAVPVMVTATGPVAAVLLAVSVNVLVFAVLLGLNDAVTPLGKPDADKLTPLLKPPCGVTVMVHVPLVPWTRLMLLGKEDKL